MARRKGKKIEIFVTIGSLKYGFLCQEHIVNTYGAKLGQKEVGSTAGIFYGANSPKPPRAYKDFKQGSTPQASNSTSSNPTTVSSFCSTQKVQSLKRDRWNVRPFTSFRGIKNAGKSRTVYVEMPGGYNYAWNLTQEGTKHMAVLGIKDATGSTDNMVWGSAPKPPRASKIELDGSAFSTFAEPARTIIDKAVGEGWSVTGVDYELIGGNADI